MIDRQGNGSRENRGTKRIMGAILEGRTNRCKGPGLGHGLPSMRKKKIIAMGRAERTERGNRDVITKVFRRRTELRLNNQEKNFKFNAGGEGKPMKSLSRPYS